MFSTDKRIALLLSLLVATSTSFGMMKIVKQARLLRPATVGTLRFIQMQQAPSSSLSTEKQPATNSSLTIPASPMERYQNLLHRPHFHSWYLSDIQEAFRALPSHVQKKRTPAHSTFIQEYGCLKAQHNSLTTVFSYSSRMTRFRAFALGFIAAGGRFFTENIFSVLGDGITGLLPLLATSSFGGLASLSVISLGKFLWTKRATVQKQRNDILVELYEKAKKAAQTDDSDEQENPQLPQDNLEDANTNPGV
jgi:hypothetical protein